MRDVVLISVCRVVTMSAFAPPPYDTRQQLPTYGTYQQAYQPAPPQVRLNIGVHFCIL